MFAKRTTIGERKSDWYFIIDSVDEVNDIITDFRRIFAKIMQDIRASPPMGKIQESIFFDSFSMWMVIVNWVLA